MDANLQKALDEAITKGTFSLDALEAIKALKEDSINVKEQLKRSEEVKQDNTIKINQLNGEVSKQVTELLEMSKRLEGIEKREKEATKLECEVEKHKAVSDAYWNITSLVFKNTTIKKEMFGTTPVAVDGGQSGCGFVQNEETKTTETETKD